MLHESFILCSNCFYSSIQKFQKVFVSYFNIDKFSSDLTLKLLCKQLSDVALMSVLQLLKQFLSDLSVYSSFITSYI